jgi:hypothetical protein
MYGCVSVLPPAVGTEMVLYCAWQLLPEAVVIDTCGDQLIRFF